MIRLIDDMVWVEEREKWFVSVVDVISILTESVDPAAYWRKLKQRLRSEGNETVTNCHGLKMKAADGKKLPDEFEDILDIVNVTVDKGVYDFSKAKTLLLFCNGVWCPQSGWAIENLMKIGYPREKLKWYRGGLYSWTQVGLTVEVVE